MVAAGQTPASPTSTTTGPVTPFRSTIQPDGDLISSNFVQEIGLDTAAGFYFAIVVDDPNFGNGARLVRGSIGTPGPVTEVASFVVGGDGPGDGDFDDIIVNALHVDNINNKIYVSYQDPAADASNTGIRQYSYNPATGAVTTWLPRPSRTSTIEAAQRR